MNKIVNYIFEIGVLNKELHNGFKLIGVKNSNSVAEHALRAAQIGYILTVMENKKNGLSLSPEKVASMLVFHDNGEVRVGDLHKMASAYIDHKAAERKAFQDQADNLPEGMKEIVCGYFDETENKNTKEGIIAKDADYLESAFMAKELYDLGNEVASDWINNVGNALQTSSAKELFEEMKKTRFTDWWVKGWWPNRDKYKH